MTLSSEAKYPSRRTYVLRVRNDATPGALAGRLENVVSGRQLDFRSDQELAALLASELRDDVAGRPAGGEGEAP